MLTVLYERFRYYVLCKGDTVEYLTRRGARIGKNCSILSMAFGAEPWLIEIGDNVTLSGNVTLVTHDASSRLFRHTIPDSSPFGNRFGKIVIRDNCFIGIGAIILPNVTIGPDSIVGAGSIVTRDVPPRTIVAGNPARQITTLDQFIEKYKANMVPIKSTDRADLRKELTVYFFGEER